MADASERAVGTCVQPECPVRRGETECALGLELIACENFLPSPDISDDSTTPNDEDDASVSASRRAPGAFDGSAAAAEPISAPLPEPVVEVEGGPALDFAAAEPEADPQPGFESRVRAPEGPRNLVEFSDQHVPMHSGLSLTVEEAQQLMANEEAVVVAFAGPAGAGKTTLLASLYENLVMAPLGNWKFAGSMSLLGFAMRAYWATTASGAAVPSTERTRRDPTRPWLHLRLRGHAGPRSMLLGDVSGEHFLAFASGGSLGPVEGHFRRADHVIHVLDTQLLSQIRDRQRALHAAELLIRRFAESDVLGSATRHTVLLTKVDSVQDDLLAMAQSKASTWVDSYLPGAGVVTTAARPEDGSESLGLIELVDVILQPRPKPADDPIQSPIGATARRLAGSRVELSRPAERDEAKDADA